MGFNGDLTFDEVDGPWRGNDFPNVSVASVTFRQVVHAFVFLTEKRGKPGRSGRGRIARRA
jgi:hypothetical protein